MRLGFCSAALMIVGLSVASAQEVSHAPTMAQSLVSAHAPSTRGVAVPEKPVARVNGAVLTSHDLLRAMYTVFPYARQHQGFPQALEPEIRKAGMEIIIFEELVY